jgi:hypothetical protein
MHNFSTDQYSIIVTEIRDRMLSAEILSKEQNLVFIESTTLQIRKILELIAYLSVLVNTEKLNHKERNQWHPKSIIEALSKKTTVFYPFPSHIFPPTQTNDQPTLMPFGYKNALSQEDFLNAYKHCGKNLHAQHPLKEKPDIGDVFKENRKILDKLKGLLQKHTIGIRHEVNKYTFLFVEVDFTNNDKTKPTTIKEYKTQIFNEKQLMAIFNTNNVYDMDL